MCIGVHMEFGLTVESWTPCGAEIIPPVELIDYGHMDIAGLIDELLHQSTLQRPSS